jgi:hypothetical protein
VLQWIVQRVLQSGGGSGVAGSVVGGGGGFEGSFVDTCKQLRAACGTVPDNMSERMPLAYVHVVQILVDLLLVLAPLALYPKVGALAVPLCGILTLFYRGLLELAKSFLDPFGNEGRVHRNPNSHTPPWPPDPSVKQRTPCTQLRSACLTLASYSSRAQNINSDVLLTEVNRGSNGWWRGGQRIPFLFGNHESPCPLSAATSVP